MIPNYLVLWSIPMDICIKIFMVESEAKICMPLNYMTFFCKSEVKKNSSWYVWDSERK